MHDLFGMHGVSKCCYVYLFDLCFFLCFCFAVIFLQIWMLHQGKACTLCTVAKLFTWLIFLLLPSFSYKIIDTIGIWNSKHLIWMIFVRVGETCSGIPQCSWREGPQCIHVPRVFGRTAYPSWLGAGDNLITFMFYGTWMWLSTCLTVDAILVIVTKWNDPLV